MYCDICGAKLRPQSRFCPSCGCEIHRPDSQDTIVLPKINTPEQEQNTTIIESIRTYDSMSDTNDKLYQDDNYDPQWSSYLGEQNYAPSPDQPFADENYDKAWDNYLKAHSLQQTQPAKDPSHVQAADVSRANQQKIIIKHATGYSNNHFVDNILPLFASPLYILIAVLSSLLAVIMIFTVTGSINKPLKYTNPDYIISIIIFICFFIFILSNVILIISSLIMIPAASRKNKFLSGVSFTLLSIYSFLSAILSGSIVGISLISLVTKAFEINLFNISQDNVTFIKQLLIFGVGITIFMGFLFLGMINCRFNRALNNMHTNVYTGVFIPICSIILSCITTGMIIYSLYNSFNVLGIITLLIILAVLGLMTAFFFVLKSKTNGNI